MNTLQKSLLLNAIFSNISGFILLLFNSFFATIFETTNTLLFKIIGSGLVFFSLTIIYEMRKQRPITILWIVTQDFIWVVGSAFILIANPYNTSSTGNILISMVSLVVLFLAVNQLRALAQIDSALNKKIKHFRFEKTVYASRQKTWEVIADVSNYHKVAPNIDDVKIISGQEEGMVRSCSHNNDSWTETCTMWNEEKSYSFEVNTSAPNYPYPLKYLKGTWEIQELNATTTTIIMFFDFQYKHSFYNWLLHPFLKKKFEETAQELLKNWQTLLED